MAGERGSASRSAGGCTVESAIDPEEIVYDLYCTADGVDVDRSTADAQGLGMSTAPIVQVRYFLIFRACLESRIALSPRRIPPSAGLFLLISLSTTSESGW